MVMTVHAQSITQYERDYYQKYHKTINEETDSIFLVTHPNYLKSLVNTSSSCQWTKRVFGFYQPVTTYSSFQWNLLSDFCYFQYAVDTITGAPDTKQAKFNLNTWSTDGGVQAAVTNGVNVVLCASMLSGTGTFFGNSTAVNTFFADVLKAMQSGKIHSLNIDFEAMSSSQQATFTSFIESLYNYLKPSISNIDISIDMQGLSYAVFNGAALSSYVNTFLLMGYDYYYAGVTNPKTVGPTDPLYTFQTGGSNDRGSLERSVNSFIHTSQIPNSKLILVLPYYGYKWQTNGLALYSTRTGGNGVAVTYEQYAAAANTVYSDRMFDTSSYSYYFPFTKNSKDSMLFIDNVYSMGKRFDIVNEWGLAGVGMWRLGFDNGTNNDYWNLISDKFSTCSTVPCSDTLFSSGGPFRTYNTNENYTYTIAPTGASTVDIHFIDFNTQPGDNVKIYDGPSTSSKLLISTSGSTVPSDIITSGNSFTLSFSATSTSPTAGWAISYNCANGVVVGKNNITGYEYWFDNNYANKDTGSSPVTNIYSFTSSISTAALTQGLHSFHIRFKDNNNNWSSPISQFFIQNAQTFGSNNIKGYEYWFDNNYAAKTSKTVTGKSIYTLNSALSLSSLTSGLHAYHARFKDTSGAWSSVVSQFFYYNASTASVAKINGYEYWFDNNYAAKTSATVTGQAIYTLNTNINLGSLSTGLHDYHIRFKDTSGNWSAVVSQFIYYNGTTSSVAKITGYEYWFDNNYVGKTSTTVGGQAIYTLNSGISLSSLSAGLHNYHIRFKDSTGNWSSVVSQFIYYNASAGSVSNITNYEYWFDNSYSAKVTGTVNAQSNYTFNNVVSATSLSTGTHWFHIRFEQNSNLWSSVLSQSFTVAATLPEPEITDIKVTTDSITFTDNDPIFVFPNPNNGHFFISTNNKMNVQSILIFNSLGKAVYNASNKTKATSWEINLHGAQGIYYVEVFDGVKTYSKKVVLAH